MKKGEEMRFQQNQRNKLKEHFKDHVFYKLCRRIHDAFLKHCPTIIVSSEELFVDAAETLDELLTERDIKAERCSELWSEKLSINRRDDANCVDMATSQAEVAMLFYTVMFGLESVNHSHYRCTLQKTLHSSISLMWNKQEKTNCENVEKILHNEIVPLTEDMLAWMKNYFISVESLTEEINKLLHPAKNQCIKPNNKEKVYYTLPYKCEDENLRIKRIDLVRRKCEEWGWLEVNTDVNDFVHFFSGKPRDCRLKWEASNAVLSFLITKLLDIKDCFDHITGCSPRAIVINQFKKSYDRHFERVDNNNKTKTEWIVRILNYKVPLELPQLPCNQGDDISNNALQEVFAGSLHITKDLHKYNE
ncbi:hypothetical protein [Prevotella sp. 885]|uniref:hypothetical protein n=1 Tax=Prevotella sp. 885 TaxID=2022527 RepID=UPI0011410895|nr:hypothetical protein [Prevotella sp. 885]